MENSARNIMVGLFVVAGLAALATLIVLFGQGPGWFRGNTYDLTIQFDSVAGIREGTPVTALGKRIGHVRSVEFADAVDVRSGVRVVAAIDGVYRLPIGSSAETVEAGLLGGGRPPIRIVMPPVTRGTDVAILDPGSSPVIRGRTKTGLDALLPPEIVAEIRGTAGSARDFLTLAQPVLRDLHEMLKTRSPSEVDQLDGPQGNLSSAMARLDQAVKHFNTVVGDPQQQSEIRRVLAGAAKITDEGQEIAANLNRATEKAVGLVERSDLFVRRATETLDRLDTQGSDLINELREASRSANRVLTELSVAAATLNREDGTAGLFLRDPRLYESATLTLERLTALIDEATLLVKQWQDGEVRVGF